MRFVILLSPTRYLKKARETTFADRPRQSKRDVVHWMIGTSIDQIANFVYAEKHRCQSTLTNHSRGSRRRRYLPGPATQRRYRSDLVVADCHCRVARADCGEPSRGKTITQSPSRIRY